MSKFPSFEGRADEPPSASLLSVATAVPPHILRQADVADAAGSLFADRFPNFDRMAHVFRTAGIRTRNTVKPIEWYFEARGWEERTAAYLEGARDLFAAAAGEALAASGRQAADVVTIVTVSSTGLATPSLEARVAERLGFRPDVERVPVFGLGCAGGVTGLALGARLARGRPGSTVLVVAVEVCSIAFRLDQLSKANIVATALFGDGAAACVLRTGEAGLAQIEGAGEHMWPGTLDIMGWDVDRHGLRVIFDREIPPFAQQHLGPAIRAILHKIGIERETIDRFVCHPGGSKVVVALERALDLDQGALDHERAVLSEHGNMSSPTVLFVLDRVRRSGLPRRAVMTALGPGFTASSISLAGAA
ncbi:MAG: type III polyketide synthase [Methylobacteriaceae bacterium]|nr:type III polyketide synthase [Methylobacteriaceae bacterium]